MIRELAGDNIWLFIGLKIGICASAFLPAVSLIAMFSIWWERKVAGHIQSRVGPMHTGGWHGWSQSIADGIKLILKEDLMPAGVDAFLFRLSALPGVFAPVFAAFLAALPFGPQFIYRKSALQIGVLYILAVLSVEVMGVILAGWSSNSKWSLYGAMREACQMVSYEIPLGISILCGVIVAGTLDMVELKLSSRPGAIQTGLSSTTRSSSRRSSCTSSPAWRKTSGPRSTCQKSESELVAPGFTPSTAACGLASFSSPNTPRCLSSAGSKPPCFLAAGTAR